MVEAHKRPGVLSDFILGSQDGIVNVLGVILGVAIASQNFRIILAGGLAATFAESISMGAVVYTSTLARRDHYLAELERERHEMQDMPEMETEEIRAILRRWGFEGKAVGSLVPLLPFIFFQNQITTGILASLVVSALTLFLVGWYKSKVTIGKPYRSGLQMAAIGTASALAGFLVGLLLSGGHAV
jgi:predicted membrane protein (TIGR00267 family)